MGRSAKVAIIAGALVVSMATQAFAQTPPAQSAPAAAESPVASSRPNRAVLATGLLTFGFSYAPAVFVASQSSNSNDTKLMIPLVGPWVDIANRPICGGGNIPCRIETGNLILLTLDGVFQAWGLAASVAGLFVSEHSKQSASLHVAPTQIGVGGYGIGAFGSF